MGESPASVRRGFWTQSFSAMILGDALRQRATTVTLLGILIFYVAFLESARLYAAYQIDLANYIGFNDLPILVMANERLVLDFVGLVLLAFLFSGLANSQFTSYDKLLNENPELLKALKKAPRGRSWNPLMSGRFFEGVSTPRKKARNQAISRKYALKELPCNATKKRIDAKGNL